MLDIGSRCLVSYSVNDKWWEFLIVFCSVELVVFVFVIVRSVAKTSAVCMRRKKEFSERYGAHFPRSGARDPFQSCKLKTSATKQQSVCKNRRQFLRWPRRKGGWPGGGGGGIRASFVDTALTEDRRLNS